MKSYKDKGIIIKIAQFKEADKFYIILGEKYSRIEAVAKGAGKVLSKKGPMLDLFNYCEFSFYKTKGIDIITEVQLIEDYQDIKNNLKSVSELFYLSEVFNKFAVATEGMDEQEIIQDLFKLLNFLQAYPDKLNLLMSILEIKILHKTGYLPELEGCIECGVKMKANESRISASRGEAGYLCSKHFNSTENHWKLVKDDIIKLQRFIIGNEDWNTLVKIKDNFTTFDHMRSIHKSWIEGILEKRLKSTNFLNLIKNK